MEAADLLSLIESLDENVVDLKETLAPFLQTALKESAAKLPLLDKAQLYVLVTYAIESLLFCRLLQITFDRYILMVIAYLRLNSVNAKEHPIFSELSRVKQYFEKIKKVESGDPKRAAISLDKAAAGRFIGQALVIDQCSFVDLVLIRERRLEMTSMMLIERSSVTRRRISVVQNPNIYPRNARDTGQLRDSLQE